MDKAELGYIVVEYGPEYPKGLVISEILDTQESCDERISSMCSVNEELGFDDYTYRIFALEATHG